MRFIVVSSWCCHFSSDFVTSTTKNSNKNLFVTCPYVLDVFFVRDTVEGDMPDRNVKALAMGSAFSLVAGKQPLP